MSLPLVVIYIALNQLSPAAIFPSLASFHFERRGSRTQKGRHPSWTHTSRDGSPKPAPAPAPHRIWPEAQLLPHPVCCIRPDQIALSPRLSDRSQFRSAPEHSSNIVLIAHFFDPSTGQSDRPSPPAVCQQAPSPPEQVSQPAPGRAQVPGLPTQPLPTPAPHPSMPNEPSPISGHSRRAPRTACAAAPAPPAMAGGSRRLPPMSS